MVAPTKVGRVHPKRRVSLKVAVEDGVRKVPTIGRPCGKCFPQCLPKPKSSPQ